MADAETFETWAIVELMGHVRLGGKLTEQKLFGTEMGRVDIPTPEGGFVTQFFGGSSVYRITPCSEEVARSVALRNQPEPVHRWELPKPAEESGVSPLVMQEAALIAARYDPDDDFGRYDDDDNEPLDYDEGGPPGYDDDELGYNAEDAEALEAIGSDEEHS